MNVVKILKSCITVPKADGYCIINEHCL